MPCQLCRERVWTHEGDKPKCAFEGERFSPDNWNCATVGGIRDLVPRWREPACEGVVVLPSYGGDQHIAAISAADLFDNHPEDEDGELWYGASLVMCWYKHRGKTEALWIVPASGPARQPTEAEALRIIALYTGRTDA